MTPRYHAPIRYNVSLRCTPSALFDLFPGVVQIEKSAVSVSSIRAVPWSRGTRPFAFALTDRPKPQRRPTRCQTSIDEHSQARFLRLAEHIAQARLEIFSELHVNRLEGVPGIAPDWSGRNGPRALCDGNRPKVVVVRENTPKTPRRWR